MPLDGVVVNSLVSEFNNKIINGRIDKIYQPEKDELIIQIRSNGETYKLLMSASSSNARIHFTNTSKKNPLSPPMFCMLLRKHLTGGRIVIISQPEFERIIEFGIESHNELGDIEIKYLYVEIMGRHSNIILTNSNKKIIDSIKHVDSATSRVRQILPGLDYSFPPSQDKLNPKTISKAEITNILMNANDGSKISNHLVKCFMGISPLIAREIVYLSLLQSDFYLGELNNNSINTVANTFYDVFEKIKSKEYNPVILYDDKNKIIDFSALHISQYPNYRIENEETINIVLEKYYYTRDQQDRIKQKSSDLVKVITNNLERCKKKLSIQQNKLKEVENRDELKVYGNLITANIHKISKGMPYIEVENYYEENSPIIKIPIDPTISPSSNAQKYFKKYNKAKNALIAVNSQLEKNKTEIDYLESLLDTINRADNEDEIIEIKEELTEQGYLKKKQKQKNKKLQTPSKPMHFMSNQGFDIYVGKNNKQNDYLTLKFARNTDLWLHTKVIPGSHTIIKAKNTGEIPPETIEEAAMLAAYYSKGRVSSNVPVDYTQVKNVKKPSGAKPGMVIYENYRTIYVTPKRV